MTLSMEQVSKVSEAFHRFEDGLILSFEFFYLPNEPLAAQVIFHARDHRVKGNVWKKVKVIVGAVEELSAKVKGNQFNSICSGVRILKFDDVWCVEIDGNYDMDADPTSLAQIREDGELYIIGRQITILEIAD
ncbi:hypothetical protein [Pseudomonas sp. SC3(2021)]|uniref:hypothetical protein n=1 Tax=Pseudomonas sp. SC3(2021) TaxID=2871493 RepID=UPI001C9E0034|nr:hypothetical protein [Pseudomonas sp. SC3(2021)]